MCAQMSSGERRCEAPYNEAPNYQVKLFPYLITEKSSGLNSPLLPLYLAFSSLLPSLSPPSLASSSSSSSYISLSLSFSPPCFASSAGRCSRQNDITTLAWWTAAFENSMYTYCMCVCVCLRSTSRSRRSSATDDSKDHHFQKRSIVCVCVSVCDDAEWNQIVCVCVCERRRIRNHEAWMGRSTLTVSKPRLWAHLKDLVLMPRCCVSTEGLKMAVITSPHSISLHLNWIWAQTVPPSVSLHWLYARCCRITYRYCNAALQSRKPLQHQLLMWKTTCCLLAFSWEHLPVTSSRSWAPTLLFNMWPLKWSYITLNA